MQKELQSGALLNENGTLNEAGYAKSLVKTYRRSDIQAKKMRIKEWDYYYVGNHDYGVALTIADNSYMGMLSFSFLDFRNKQTAFDVTKSIIVPFTKGKWNMPASSATGDIAAQNKTGSISFSFHGKDRILRARHNKFYEGKPLEVEIKLTQEPKESMVIAVPFPKVETAFYYNQKINCMAAEGYCLFNGELYQFNKENQSFGTLDWGRGVWTYKNTWYWGSLSASLNGVPFGFNIGYGFGDTSKASENMLFYDGKAHKLEDVNWHIPMKDGKEDYLAPWTFTSNNNRLTMNFTPIHDRYANLNVGILCSIQHQVFGKFSGSFVLDDGTTHTFENVVGFAEKVHNKW